MAHRVSCLCQWQQFYIVDIFYHQLLINLLICVFILLYIFFFLLLWPMAVCSNFSSILYSGVNWNTYWQFNKSRITFYI